MARRSRRRHPKGYGDFGVLPFAIPMLPAIAAALGLTAYFVTKKKPLEQSAGRLPGNTGIPTTIPTGNTSVDTKQAVYTEAGIDTSGATSSDAATRNAQLDAAVRDSAGTNETAAALLQDSIVVAGLVTAVQSAWAQPGSAANVSTYAAVLGKLADHWRVTREAAAAQIGLPAVKPLTSAPPPKAPAVVVAPPVVQAVSSALPSNFFDRQVATVGLKTTTGMKSASFFSGYFDRG